IRAAALQPDAELAERRRLALLLVGLHEAGEGLAQGGAYEGFLGAHCLLVQDEKRLAEVGVALVDFILQHSGLGVLAT
nr:hypothetical protein [Tanacetum cinerariifolium]